MDTNGMAPEAAPNPVESPLVNADLSSSSLEQELGLGESGTEQAGGQAQGQAFKFAGREYPNQSAAEKAVSKMYGQFADTKGIVNTIKKALNDPELLEALQDDPRWAPILEKLGIEQATEDLRRQDRQTGQPPSQEQMYREWQIERDVDRIEREEYRFEKTLGRPISPEERRNTLQMIKQADTLTYEQAYFLGNRDRVMAQARQPAQPTNGKPQGNRPAPPPVRGSQGGPVNGKKGVHTLTANEWKENLRNSDEFKEILSRRG